MAALQTIKGKCAHRIEIKELGPQIDFAIMPGLQGGPHLHTIAGIAIALRLAQGKLFGKYARQVIANAQTLASEFMRAGLKVVSGGTDKHLVLLDLRDRQTDGATVAQALEKVGIITNKNTVPFDTGSPIKPSGVRMGTPALTVRGMKETEMKLIAGFIIAVIKGQSRVGEIKKQVFTFCKKFPIWQ